MLCMWQPYPSSIFLTSVCLALSASSPKAVFRMRRISRGNSLSGVRLEYHASYTNCMQQHRLSLIAQCRRTQQASGHGQVLCMACVKPHNQLRVYVRQQGLG